MPESSVSRRRAALVEDLLVRVAELETRVAVAERNWRALVEDARADQGKPTHLNRPARHLSLVREV